MQQFLPQYGKIAAVLTELTKKGAKFQWPPMAGTAFEELKEMAKTGMKIRLPDYSIPFYIFTDASGLALGDVLVQEGAEGTWMIVSCVHKKFNDAQCSYNTTKRELLGILYTMRKLRTYVLGMR